MKQSLHVFFITKTSKFWPRLVVLKFLHNLSLNCSFKVVLVSIMSIIAAYTVHHCHKTRAAQF